MSFILNFWLASNTIKIKSTCNKFGKVFIEIPGTYKKNISVLQLHQQMSKTNP